MRELRIHLPREVMAECKQAASLRWQLARAAGVKNQRRDDTRDDADVDLLGIKAEAAVARAYCLKFNPFAMGIDDGSDMFFQDIGIDVKASFHQDGRLAFKHIDAFKADLAVLVTASSDDSVMRIIGWVTQERFRKEATVQDLGSGRAMVLGQDRLSAPDSLWRYFTNKANSMVMAL